MIKRKRREMNVNVNLHSLNTTDAESIMPNLRRHFSKFTNLSLLWNKLSEKKNGTITLFNSYLLT